MGLTLVTGPAVEPVSLAEAKAHLRVDDDDSNDLIVALIGAARQHVESFTRRKLITQTWDYQIDQFPSDAIVVPLAPVASVTSITYLDTAGATQTWSSSNYRTDLPSGPWAQRPRIEPGYGLSYPLTYGVMNAVAVRCVVGYGSTASTVPAAIRAAMKILIGHWFEHREPVVTGTIVAQMPMSVNALLWPFKVW